ncbi:hypothetical protein ACFPMF_15380 [Larkinella bovis]|uniref:DUF3467 domain-containing protein n=1 Tax=Larkinella bovis TaxID=683041 RepID=A0ABW0ICS8_9BACT
MSVNSDSDFHTMSFVIGLEDATGQEFYISVHGTAVALDARSGAEPMILKNHNQVARHIEPLRRQFPANCSLIAWERKEFEQKRKDKLKPPQKT